MNKRSILFTIMFLSMIVILSACSAANYRNIILGNPIIVESGGIVLEVPTQTMESIYYEEGGSYTACYIKIANKTDKKIHLENNYFVIRDDSNHLYPSIPLIYMEKVHANSFVPSLDFKRDSNGNFRLVTKNIDEQMNLYYQEDTAKNVKLKGLTIGEVSPGNKIEGYIYFPEVTTFAENKITLLINIPDYTANTLQIEFVIQ